MFKTHFLALMSALMLLTTGCAKHSPVASRPDIQLTVGNLTDSTRNPDFLAGDQVELTALVTVSSEVEVCYRRELPEGNIILDQCGADDMNTRLPGTWRTSYVLSGSQHLGTWTAWLRVQGWESNRVRYTVSHPAHVDLPWVGPPSITEGSQDVPLLRYEIMPTVQGSVWRRHTLTICTDFAGSNGGEVLNDIKVGMNNRVVVIGPMDGIVARPLGTTSRCSTGLRGFELTIRDMVEVPRGSPAEFVLFADLHAPTTATTLQITFGGWGERMADNLPFSYRLTSRPITIVRQR